MLSIWLLAVSLGMIKKVPEAASANQPKTPDSGKVLYDFTKITSLDRWIESSDTVREPGMSKASFVLQKTQQFQTSVFFSLLNPQPNGAAFAGYYTNDTWNLSSYAGLQLKVRAQGDNYNYKLILRHKGDTVDNSSHSYEVLFKVIPHEWMTVNLPFKSFKAYFRGRPVPNAEPLDTSYISSIGIQIVGGVYKERKQKGASSLEIDSIQAI